MTARTRAGLDRLWSPWRMAYIRRAAEPAPSASAPRRRLCGRFVLSRSERRGAYRQQRESGHPVHKLSPY